MIYNLFSWFCFAVQLSIHLIRSIVAHYQTSTILHIYVTNVLVQELINILMDHPQNHEIRYDVKERVKRKISPSRVVFHACSRLGCCAVPGEGGRAGRWQCKSQTRPTSLDQHGWGHETFLAGYVNARWAVVTFHIVLVDGCVRWKGLVGRIFFFGEMTRTIPDGGGAAISRRAGVVVV